ncbi:MAG: NAD(P)-dependent oxidoreductase [Coriobacteriales bacterium]|jgi:nucleoside-diphosphate-sugar epimerase|nr:NAD(P)-dependent oxidoreductase [Coriobacteriales bacterium]
MKKILVTGGAGFIGYHLTDHLQKTDAHITIIDNLSRSKVDEAFSSLCKKTNVTFINADMTGPNFTSNLADYYDEIYHLAAVNGTKNFYSMPQIVLKVNILSLIYLLEWISADNCGKFVFTSSSEAYAGTISRFGIQYNFIPTKEDIPLTIDDVFNARFSYGGSKLAGELLTVNYCRAKKVPFSIVRYHNIYGPRMGFDHVIPEFCERIYRQVTPFPIYGGGDTRAFCYVSDGVHATQLVMESAACNEQVVHIGNDTEEITIRDMAKVLFDVCGYTSPIMLEEAPKGSVKRRCPDISKLKRLVGFKPVMSLREGLVLTSTWYMNYWKTTEPT